MIFRKRFFEGRKERGRIFRKEYSFIVSLEETWMMEL